MENTVQHWMQAQARLGRQLYLILDCDGQEDAFRALRNSPLGHLHVALYADTPVAELADAGPVIVQPASFDEPAIDALLDAPETNWGWLASGEPNGLDGVARHWRKRLVVGERPHQALYRFHDNRVLGQALRRLPAEALPGYLGPLASVCYWQVSGWSALDNPRPGEHAVPAEPAWLDLPGDGVSVQVLRDNLRRYLLAEHGEAFAQLAQRRDPNEWLSEQLLLAQRWNWREAEQTRFLTTQSLYAPDNRLAPNWQPNQGESPQRHFERLYQEARFWSGEASL